MRRALRIARRGDTSPNPRVGAVVVKRGEVVGEGYHERAGGPHAEVNALRNAGERAKGATIYVTLEPCNHHGRTPPCTEAVIAAGVRRVVVASADRLPHVHGSADRLRDVGIEVLVGVRADEGERLVESFFHHVETRMPFVTLKSAVTLDGKMASRTGDSRWITSKASRREAHRMRAECDAVLVGIETVLADDPRLDVRHVRGRNPVRVVLDTRLRTPADAAVIGDDGRCVIVHATARPGDAGVRLRDAGAELLRVRRNRRSGSLDLRAAMEALGGRDLVRVMVEGGPRVHGALLDAGLAHRADVFVAPRILGDAEAPAFASGRGSDTIAASYRLRNATTRCLGPDTLISGRLERPEDGPDDDDAREH